VKVLLATDVAFHRNSGLARAARNLSLALMNRGVQVAVIAPEPSQDPVAEQRLSSPTLYRVRSRSIRSVSNQPVPSRVSSREVSIKAFTEWEPDIVHVMTPFVIGRETLKQAAQQRTPSVLAIHVLPSNATSTSPVLRAVPKLAPTLVRAAYRHAAQEATVLAAPSVTGAGAARAVAASKECVVISNGATPFQPSPDMNRSSGGGRVRVLYVGRLAREKRVEVLIEAVRILPEPTRITLAIVGDGDQRRQLERLAGGMPSVVFLGNIPDRELADEYRTADLFCMPGTSELECIAVLEALSFGVPCVVAASSALRELPAWSSACLLTEPDNPRVLAAAIWSLVNNDSRRRAMSASAIAERESRTLEVVSVQWLELYARLLKGSSKRKSMRTARTLGAASS
jgi:1,2-diacylglycerol 3-alpha-glucosyltransferase